MVAILLTCLAVGVVRGNVQHKATPPSQRVFIAATFTSVRVERTAVKVFPVSISEVSHVTPQLFITAWNTHRYKYPHTHTHTHAHTDAHIAASATYGRDTKTMHAGSQNGFC